MSVRYADISIPGSYWIAVTHYRCAACGSKFEWRWPEGGEIVKFVELGGDEERYLPTFGEGGYFWLLERLVRGYSTQSEISVTVAREFRRAFAGIQELSPRGQEFVVDDRAPRCPNCGDTHVEVVSSIVERNPSVGWLRYKWARNP
jgi:DNA-directed RNA polymerase subunit RPC12/RpoP